MSQEQEIELSYMAEVMKPEGFDQSSAIEMQEQFEYRLPPGVDGVRRGKVRIRKTTKNNESTYTETIKLPLDPSSTLGDMESSMDITEPYYNAWKKLYRVSGQSKIRYVFISDAVTMKYDGNELKLPPVKFEVDIFIDVRGRRSKWAKIDIEVQDIVKLLKESYETVDAAKFEISFDSLPLGIGQVVPMNTNQAEERAAIDNFFKMYSIPYEAVNAR